MALTYSVKANSVSIPVSNTEVIVASSQTLANTIASGDVIRIRLNGALDIKSQYTLNVRMGANGNTSDNVIFSSNNVITKTALLNDLNNWQNNNPGFTPNEYVFSSALPQFPQTPAGLSGELLVIVTGTGSNGNVAVWSNSPVVNTNNLLQAFGPGVLAVANGVNTSGNNIVTVGLSMVGAGAYTFNPLAGVEGPGNKWIYSQAANSNTTTVTFSVVEGL